MKYVDSSMGRLTIINQCVTLVVCIFQKRMSQRASSAVHNEARIHIREREKTVLGVPHENRPSTTHALYRVSMLLFT